MIIPQSRLTIFSRNIPPRITYSRLGISSRTSIGWRGMMPWWTLSTRKIISSAPIPKAVKPVPQRSRRSGIRLIPTRPSTWIIGLLTPMTGSRRSRKGHARMAKREPVVNGITPNFWTNVGLPLHFRVLWTSVNRQWISSAANPSPLDYTGSMEALEMTARGLRGSWICGEWGSNPKSHPRTPPPRSHPR